MKDFGALVWCRTWQCWVNVGLGYLRGLFQPKQFHDFPLTVRLPVHPAAWHWAQPRTRDSVPSTPRAQGWWQCWVTPGTFTAPQGQGWPVPQGTAGSKQGTAGAGSGATLAAWGCPCFQLSGPQRAPVCRCVGLAAGAGAGWQRGAELSRAARPLPAPCSAQR